MAVGGALALAEWGMVWFTRGNNISGHPKNSWFGKSEDED